MTSISNIDLAVMIFTLLFIVLYGTWKTKQQKNLNSYLKGGNELGWFTVGLSVMATQASAITFISTPGQAFESGMGFVQNYFGLPLALIIVSVVFIPIFYKLNVFTAYEYLEGRFNLKTRILTASLFLVQRGLAAGITIYAPALVLCSMFNWDLNFTIIWVGLLVIVYTVSGGSKAVSITQKLQMAVIMGGMFLAFGLLLSLLPKELSFMSAIKVAGVLDKMEVVDFSFDFEKRYTFWSGITGGFFLALSYFGTDQSQVQRYLTAKNVNQSRMGMMFNAALKIPMQFFILLTGVLVFVFYQFNTQPLIFNKVAKVQLEAINPDFVAEKQEAFTALHTQKQEKLELYFLSENPNATLKEEIRTLHQQERAIKAEMIEAVKAEKSIKVVKDSDFVFLTFITDFLPIGVVGILLAMIISAAMSSTSSEINALASTLMIDFYKRFNRKTPTEKQQVTTSKLLTAGWGVLAIIFALFANLAENLIEAVNILGSVFYGTILGIFLTAFFIKKASGNGVFTAAVLAQLMVFALFAFSNIGYLWFNFIGCVVVMAIAYTHSVLYPPTKLA
ncbi:MAG: sodium:solute symporter [Luteibaculaceae bacterium]